MFDLPEAKRVRRSDLNTRSQSSSPQPSEPDSELEAQLHARLTSLYGSSFDTSAIVPASQPTAASNVEPQSSFEDMLGEDEAPEYEFRLFSAGENNKTEPQKIVLQVEEDGAGDGGFVVPDRNPRYYFAEKAVGERKWRIEVAALAGEQVLDLSKRRAWGLEVPWRVTVLKTTGKSKGAAPNSEREDRVVAEDIGDGARRKRPGKKRRVILRQRKKKKDEIEEKKKREKELKDETEREKRTRRNREKKVKKKMKEKAKKAEGAVISAVEVDVDGSMTSVAEGQEEAMPY